MHSERQHALDEAAVRQFNREGYLGPFTVRSPEEMAEIRASIEESVLDSDDGPQAGVPVHDRHRDRRVIYDLVSDPAIVDRMASLYGDGLLLWATHFWNKEPGDPEIPWHQDLSGWPIEPLLNVSAWIAIDEVTAENSPVKLIPGSHGRVIPQVDAPEESWFDRMADPEAFDEGDAVEMELQPGEFFLFTERTLHCSEPNTSAKRRLGMSMRVTVPFVNIDHDDLYAGHRATLLSGEDYHGINDTERGPPDGS